MRLSLDAVNQKISGTAAWHMGSVSVDIAGGAGSTTLTDVQASNKIIVCTGVKTGNRNVVLPLLAGLQYTIVNNSSGAFTTTYKGATGTGIDIGNSKTAIIWCDGTNYLRVTADNP